MPRAPRIRPVSTDPTRPAQRRSSVIAAALLVAAAAIVVYLNTIPNGFVIDDRYQVVDNPWISGPDQLGVIFTSGVWEFDGRHSSYFRPMMFVHYMAIQMLAGRSAWAFHLGNVLLHAVVAVLVLLVALRAFAADRFSASEPLWPATVAALLFAVHPIHTEAVAWVAAVVDLGYTLFGLIALLAYIAGRDRRAGWMVVSGIAFLVALLFKESAITIPLVLAAWEWTVGRDERHPWVRIGLETAALVGAFVLYLALRWNAFGGLAPTAAGDALGPTRWAIAVVAVAVLHLGKLLLPVNLNVWHVFDPPTSAFSSRAVATLGFLLICVAAWIWGARRSRVIAFGGALVVIPLLPTFHFSALNLGLASAFAERYLYLPSVGFVLIAAHALDALRRRVPRGNTVAGVVVAGLVLAYGAGTMARNAVWKDSLTIWEDAVRKSPDSGVAQFNYGAALRYHGRKEEGMAAIRRGVALEPGLLGRELAKGQAYARQGRYEKAVLAFHTALILDPGNADAHFGLGLLYESRGSIDAAMREYAGAIATRPEFAEAHNNLGVLYAGRGRIEDAIVHFETAARLRPDDPDYRANLERARGR